MTRPLRAHPAGPDDVGPLMTALRAALDGTGPAVLPVPTRRDPGDHSLGVVPDDVALVVRTSGSTGDPREVMLTASALRASAAATQTRLGGPAQWLLTLPPHHVAGIQVIIRSLLAGTEPVVGGTSGGGTSGGFTPAGFAADTDRLTADRRNVSLVPTQLHRLLDGDPAGLAALRTFDAVLLGGAATPPPLLGRARTAGVRVVTTYGMTETCGGCVYDGVPLDGVRVRLDDGAILLGGPVLARGYRDRPDLDADAFEPGAGSRWLRTRDVGRLDDGVLTVLGRADDVLVTGGVKVAPAAVERELAGLDGVGEACVVGVPDAEWGQAVVAVVVPPAGHPGPSVAAVRSHVATTLGAPAAPRHVVLVDRLPHRGPGKVDRRAVAELAARRLNH